MIIGICTIEFECSEDEFKRHLKEKKGGEKWTFTPQFNYSQFKGH